MLHQTETATRIEKVISTRVNADSSFWWCSHWAVRPQKIHFDVLERPSHLILSFFPEQERAYIENRKLRFGDPFPNLCNGPPIIAHPVLNLPIDDEFIVEYKPIQIVSNPWAPSSFRNDDAIFFNASHDSLLLLENIVFLSRGKKNRFKYRVYFALILGYGMFINQSNAGLVTNFVISDYLSRTTYS